MDKPPYQVNLDIITFTSNLGTFCNFSFTSFLLRVLISEKKNPEHFQLVYCLNSISYIMERNSDLIWPLHLSVLLCWKQKIFWFILGCLGRKIFNLPLCESIIIVVLNSNTMYVSIKFCTLQLWYLSYFGNIKSAF